MSGAGRRICGGTKQALFLTRQSDSIADFSLFFQGKEVSGTIKPGTGTGVAGETRNGSETLAHPVQHREEIVQFAARIFTHAGKFYADIEMADSPGL